MTTELRYMPCTEFEISVHGYVDGELAQPDVKSLLVHIELCDGCRGAVDSLRQQIRMHQGASDLEKIDAPLGGFEKDSFFARLSDRLVESNLARVAALLYELGKAYYLAGNDSKLMMFLHRKAVALERAGAEGRRLVKETIDLAARATSVPRRTTQSLKRTSQLFRGRDGARNSKSTRIGVRSGRTALDNARHFLEECLILAEDHAAARLYLGAYFVRIDRPEEAIAEYQKILALPKLDKLLRVMTLQSLGNAYGYRCDYGKAVECFEQIRTLGHVENDPKFFTIHLSLAMFYAKLERFDRSAAAFGELLTRFPNKLAEVRATLEHAEVFRTLLRSRTRFRNELLERYPVLFAG